MNAVAESQNASITPEQAAGILAALQQEILAGAFETEQVEAESQVTANQHYAITGLGFLFMMFLETAMGFGVKKRNSAAFVNAWTFYHLVFQKKIDSI